MSQNFEIEFKNLLTKEEYFRLYYAYELDKENAFSQMNYYFDTPNFQLRKAHAALRIRFKNSKTVLTLKTPYKEHLLETNKVLDFQQAENIIEQGILYPPQAITEQLTKSNICLNQSLGLKAVLETRRIEKVVDNHLIVLDKNWYNQTIDYELEIESDNHQTGQAFFKALLTQHTIPKRDTLNKVERAYETLP